MVAHYYRSDSCETDSNIGYLIRRSALLLTEHIESVFRDRNISFTQWLALKILGGAGPLSLHELCGHIGYDPATVSRAVEGLCADGLVARARSTTDRRSVALSLTAKGKSYVQKHSAIALGELNVLLEDFSREEADTLIALMQRVLAKLVAVQHKRRGADDVTARRRVS
jgi:DNA-binding MarR family transcriptional regulator